MAHFALQKLRIRPKVLSGECTINDPIDDKERAFIYGSILTRVENEKKKTSRIKHFTPRKRRNRKR
ncbi:hypothetical protein [Clostridium sp. Cult2]|uniref:hypothetical protein n=1 Tax=Clostridium sp. Cult2 TaxID=2079003 RepID=UPI001F1D044D|nr:hypothetical protein [Clostridium sp. Cult2]MCF6466342.1 hypothetical protein [Clostridium sp. Cult2]